MVVGPSRVVIEPHQRVTQSYGGIEGQIRVLLVISNLEYGGAQRQVVELCNNVDHERFDVHVCSLSDYVPLGVDIRNASTRLHVIEKRGKFDVTVVPRLARLLKALDIDIVHSYLFDAEIAGRLAGRMAGTAAIVGSERNADYVLKRRQLAAYRLTKRCVDLIVANSQAGADFNSRMLGYDASMYRVVHNGVDVNRFVPADGNRVRKALGIDEEEPVVGMFASFKRQKNHPMFFAAARRVLDRLPTARFVLVGDMLYGGMHGSDEYTGRMHRLVDELGIRNKCLLLGNRQDVAELYTACDVTVLPSLFEGTPNVLLESMACQVPVVVTDVSDNARIVRDAETGFLVRLGDDERLADRLLHLLTEDNVRRAMGRAGREWVTAEFSTRALVRKTERVYIDVLSTRTRASVKKGARGAHAVDRVDGAPDGS